MNSSKLWASIAIFLGSLAVILSVWKGVEWFKFVKPFFHVSLFLFYCVTAKKFNWILLLFLTSTMTAEFLAATNFITYIMPIMVLFTLYFTLGVVLQYPVLKSTKLLKLRGVDLLLAAGGVFLLVYIILSVFFVSARQIEEFNMFSIATFVFSIFIASSFFIAGFHNHPKKILLFIVGACYVIVCTGSLLYELQYHSIFLLGIVNLTEVIAQMAFVYFLIYREDMLEAKKWLI